MKNVLPALLTIKKELPPIFKSNALSVLSKPPSEEIAVEIEPTDDPRPICIALVPPFPVSALGPDAI